MVTFSERKGQRSSPSVPSLPRQTLQLAALGTDVSRNVSLNRSLARNIPPIEFSGPLKGIPEVRRASVPRSIDTGRVSPQKLGDSEDLFAFGKAVKNKFFPSPERHFQTATFSPFEKLFGGSSQGHGITSGMGAGKFSGWFRGGPSFPSK